MYVVFTRWATQVIVVGDLICAFALSRACHATRCLGLALNPCYLFPYPDDVYLQLGLVFLCKSMTLCRRYVVVLLHS
jgi:hypothetical protein